MQAMGPFDTCGTGVLLPLHILLFLCLSIGSFAQPPEKEEGHPLPILTSVFDNERSPQWDIVTMRDGTVLNGEILHETVTMATPYGNLVIPLRRVAGICFGCSNSAGEVLATVNFNRISGTLLDSLLRIRRHDSEEVTEFPKEQAAFILLKRADNEHVFVGPAPASDLFLMTNGDWLTGKTKAEHPAITVPGFKAPLPFEDFKTLELPRTQDEYARGVLKDSGSPIVGKIETDTISLELELGVLLEHVDTEHLAEIDMGEGSSRAAAEFSVREKAGRQAGEAGPPRSELVNRHAGDIRSISLGSGQSMELVWIPPGNFKMGCKFSPEKMVSIFGGKEDVYANEVPQHEVTISKGFWLGKFEVTQGQWLALMPVNSSHFEGGFQPVETVSWNDTQEFIGKLSTLGLEGRFRLPTEAEWEYACRAGSTTLYGLGDDTGDGELCAWWMLDATCPAGVKRANIWGLHDMHGNVSEWCEDWYDADYYNRSPKQDPRNTTDSGKRVRRGGSYSYLPVFCRSASRAGKVPEESDQYVGFRLVFDPM